MMSNKIRTHQITEVSHVVQVRAEGPKAPSPGRALKKSLHGLC